ncbi:hypothetical protein [Serratia sp. JSRIV006]|uniref:hypothetical protein n=1 Tax=Serratia sp. JSRIV006 TaxID=2831896 RepID=UPI001CBF99D4|nr:hypothetical protein [Serratia sp. JSRIV006]UAN64252.1 hypothetical protein KGP16_06670 [Serratia sp. JSRIV006]
MTDKLEALRLEAETLSGLMMQLAENEIDSDSFAVMSDLGENGTEHECDLPITETALRASAVIDQLLAALEEKDQRIAELQQRLQQHKPIKLPAEFFIKVSGQAVSVMGTAAVMHRIRSAGHKVEVE